MSKGDVQVVEPTAVVTPTPFDRFRDNIQTRAREIKKDGTRNSAIMEKQATAILNAQSIDDIWDADEGGTVNGQDFVNVPIEIRGYELAASDTEKYSSDLDVYVNMDCAVLVADKGYQPGDQVIINVGGLLVVTKLEMLRANNGFPCKAVIRPAGRALKLKRYAGEAVSSNTE